MENPRASIGEVLLAPTRIYVKAMLRGDRRVMLGWALHVPAVIVVLWWVAAVGRMPVWAFLVSTYAALSVLKIAGNLERIVTCKNSISVTHNTP